MLHLPPYSFTTDVRGEPSCIEVLSFVVDASCPILSNPTEPASVQYVYALTGNRNLKGKNEYFIVLLVELLIAYGKIHSLMNSN